MVSGGGIDREMIKKGYYSGLTVGQPPLKKNISFTKFLPLRQRISVAWHIAPLTKDQAYGLLRSSALLR
jgi:type II secretory pathway predicted ATPase ExeA